MAEKSQHVWGVDLELLGQMVRLMAVRNRFLMHPFPVAPSCFHTCSQDLAYDMGHWECTCIGARGARLVRPRGVGPRSRLAFSSGRSARGEGLVQRKHSAGEKGLGETERRISHK